MMKMRPTTKEGSLIDSGNTVLMNQIHMVGQNVLNLSSRIDHLEFTLTEQRYTINKFCRAIKEISAVVEKMDTTVDTMWRDFSSMRGSRGSFLANTPSHIMKEFWCTYDESLIADGINVADETKVLSLIEGIELKKIDFMPLTLPKDCGTVMSKWLDDKVVDCRIHDMRMHEPIDSDRYLECATMYPQLVMSSDDDNPLKFNSKPGANYLQKRRIFIPMCIDNHWLLAVIDSCAREIQLLNSQPCMSSEMGMARRLAKGVENQVRSVAAEVEGHEWPSLAVSKWKMRCIEGLPKQCDSCSCGLFMLKFMEHWDGHYLKIDFKQEDIDHFRKKLGAIIVNSEKNILKQQASPII